MVTGDFGNVERTRLKGIVYDIAELKKQGREVLVVSSGAVGLGRKLLDQHEKNGLPFRQACAAIGQGFLMTEYQKLFATHDLSVAQVLVTANDLSSRKNYLNLRSMLRELLALGVIPIINENDSVSTMELAEQGREKSFGDNDKLSALVASKLEADLLILLTDVDGFFDVNPKLNSDAKLIKKISELDELKSICHLKSEPDGESIGRGGLDSKVKAVQLASMSGVFSIVTSGMIEGRIAEIFSDGQTLPENFRGTCVWPTGKVSARKKWIGFSSGVEGIVTVNKGARLALETTSASLLAVGIIGVEGGFASGDVVSIEAGGVEVGRGIVNYSSEDIVKLIGHKSSGFAKLLGRPTAEEIVHKDRLVVFDEKKEEDGS